MVGGVTQSHADMPGFAHKTSISPRVRIACRLFSSGAAKTKRQASEMAGLHPQTLSVYRDSPQVRNLVASIDERIEQGILDIAKLRAELGVRALRNIAEVMEDTSLKAEIRLKAAVDLADRSTETSKVIKHEVETSPLLTGKSVDALRAALLESARAREVFAAAAEGNYVTTNDENAERHLALVKEVPLLASGDG